MHSKDIESCLDITFRDIERYQGWLLKQPQYCAGSVETYMRAVHVFYKYLRRQNHIISNPADLVPLPKQSHKLPRNVLTEDEMQSLLDAPDTETDRGVLHRAILETFYATGIRLTALCSISLFDCNTQRQEIRVREKGSKDRILPLTNSASMWLRLYIQTVRPKIIADRNNAILFVGWQRGRSIKPKVIQNFIRDYAKKSGITKKVSPHTIRATVATHLLKRGCSLFEVQEIMGHSLVSTTQRYTRVVPRDLQDNISRYHPRENPLKEEDE
ncbi:MAG: tyrosine-type recombinase/integrase [Actinobacteria bacterium]|nr:tyrosine-type recombinase/integrase [Actinomycetota bacterium]